MPHHFRKLPRHQTLSKKRVYDLAKEYGMTGQELASKLRDLGFVQIKSHMTALTDPEVLEIQARLEAYGYLGEASGAAVQTIDGVKIKRKKKKPAAPEATETPAAEQEPAPLPIVDETEPPHATIDEAEPTVAEVEVEPEEAPTADGPPDEGDSVEGPAPEPTVEVADAEPEIQAEPEPPAAPTATDEPLPDVQPEAEISAPPPGVGVPIRGARWGAARDDCLARCSSGPNA